MLEFAEKIGSDEFAQSARHPKFPNAFTRSRKLPLPVLIGTLLSMRNQAQQAMLDGFFASACDVPGFERGVSDRAFAKARERLHLPALQSLNDWLIRRAGEADLIEKWHGFRVVAADASLLMPAIRPCLRVRSPAQADQRLFALYLPGSELTLHASVNSAQTGERSMLMESLDSLGPDDVLVLDRGYPAAWLVNLLNTRGIRFVVRCDSAGGWSATKEFLLSGADEAWVTLNTPSAEDVRDWGCSAQAPRVRLVRQRAPNGKVRVLATNLTADQCDATLFGDLYHQRWRIEEAFKRLKHRMKLESVSGLSQQSLVIDVAAKVLADNIGSLMCIAAAKEADLAARSRKCNRSYAATLMQRLLPRLVLCLGDLWASVTKAIELLSSNTQRFIPGRSQARPANPTKPHPSACYKG